MKYNYLFIFTLLFYSCNPFQFDQPATKRSTVKKQKGCEPNCEKKEEGVDTDKKYYNFSFKTDAQLLSLVQLKTKIEDKEEVINLSVNKIIFLSVPQDVNYELDLIYDANLGTCNLSNAPISGIVTTDLIFTIECIPMQEESISLSVMRLGSYQGNLSIQLDIPDENESFNLAPNQSQMFEKTKDKNFALTTQYDQNLAECLWTPNLLSGVLDQNLSFTVVCNTKEVEKVSINIERQGNFTGDLTVQLTVGNDVDDFNLPLNQNIQVMKDKGQDYSLSSQYDTNAAVCTWDPNNLQGKLSQNLSFNIICNEKVNETVDINFIRSGDYTGVFNIQLDIPDESESFSLASNQSLKLMKTKGKSYQLSATYDTSAATCTWTPNTLQGNLNQNLSFSIVCSNKLVETVDISFSRSGNFSGNLAIQINVSDENELITLTANQNLTVKKTKGKSYSIIAQYNMDTIECNATPNNLSGSLTQNLSFNFECNNKDIGNNAPMYQNPKLRLTFGVDPATSMRIIYDATTSNNTIYYGLSDNLRNYAAYEFNQDKSMSNNYGGMKNASFRLENLQPDTNYYFVIKDGDEVTERFWFTTMPNDNTTPISIISGGDSRNNHEPRIRANKMVAKLRPHFVMFGGDYTAGASAGEWQDWFDHWQHTITSDNKVIPLIPTRGNHENGDSEMEQLFDTISPRLFYAQSFGGNLLRIYTLNSEVSTTGDQKQWLAQDLAQYADQHIYKFAQYHRPIEPITIGKSPQHNIKNHWAPLFYQHGVDLVSESDTHLVSWTWPIKPSDGPGSDVGFIRDDENGTVYVGAGTWGAPLRSANNKKDWTRDAGSFNQFKWIFVDKNRIEVRTVQYDNLSNVQDRTDQNRFEIPNNLTLWQPSNGGLITIYPDNANKVSLVSPQNNESYNTGDTVSLQARADILDTSVSLTSVKFYLNNNFLGDGQSTGNNVYQHNWNTTGFQGVAKIYIEFTFSDGNKLKTAERVFNIGIVSKTYNLVNGNDDGEEYNNSMNLSSSDLEMVYDGSKKQKIGLRFDSIDIPKNSNIQAAYIIFNAKYSDNADVNLQISMEESVSPNNLSNQNLSNRKYFNMSIPWSPGEWIQGEDYQSVDIKDLIQLVVNQDNWATNNAILIKIDGDNNSRRAYSCNANNCNNAPKLNLIYSP